MRLTLVLVAVVVASLPPPAPGASPPPTIQPGAGFEHLTTPNGVEVGIWFPAQGQVVTMPLGPNVQQVIPSAALPEGKHALVVISHGTGGAYSGHADTAIALAKAGFIVAALTHPGDNWRDQSRVAMVEDRPRALSALIDMMLTIWKGAKAVDAGHIAAFGFSAGGFTVMAAAGARPDLSTIARHCADHPTWFDCRLLASHPHAERPAWSWQGDRRIKALVVAAPALGFAFDRAGLASLSMPIQLWRADEDEILPAPDYADAVRAALPRAPEFHGVRKAGHFDFLMPCTSRDALPEICSSKFGFDRAAFHRAFNARIVRFLTKALYERKAGSDSAARASE
ncbi:dienelactone hydrolase [Novosphingobium sp.]|uniref:alpha/beta hydrolase family protein n=1 Tax=Novosphingobium sp. TaxID=1874826 RepID=UPI0031E41F46